MEINNNTFLELLMIPKLKLCLIRDLSYYGYVVFFIKMTWPIAVDMLTFKLLLKFEESSVLVLKVPMPLISLNFLIYIYKNARKYFIKRHWSKT